MNYSKALLLATIAILATFSPAGAMEINTKKTGKSKKPAAAFVMSPGKQSQESGEGDNSLVYQRHAKRTRLYNPDSEIQPKQNPTQQEKK